MKTLTKLISTDSSVISSQNYEVIENENLENCVVKGLTLSGSLFSLSSFKGVTFDSCVFFATKFENCEFIDCKFENCSFEFSSIEYSDFHSCIIKNCDMEFTPFKKSLFARCEISGKVLYFINKDGNNKLMDLVATEKVNKEQKVEVSLPAINVETFDVEETSDFEIFENVLTMFMESKAA